MEDKIQVDAEDGKVEEKNENVEVCDSVVKEGIEKGIEGEGITGNSKLNLNKNCSRSQKKKHIIDELDLGVKKSAKLSFAITPPAKSKTVKNFIKRNMKISTHCPPLLKPSPAKDDSLISELLDEGPKKKNPDIKERFYDKAETYKKKKEELRDKFDKEELSACTFQPKTNSKDKPLLKPSNFNAKLDEYISRQRKNKEKAMEDAKKIAEKAENDEDLSYKPKICEKSKEILMKKAPQEGPIYERLYNHGKAQPKVEAELENESNVMVEESEICFHPTINKKSQNLLRTERIENILYEDAIRRKNNPPQMAKSPTPRFMGSNSEKVLIDKFKREFWDVVNQIVINTELVNYSKISEIFKSLYFIREDKEDQDKLHLQSIWRSYTLNEEDSLTKPEVLSLSLAVMGFFEDWMLTESPKARFTKEEVQKFHKKNEQLYKNRTLVTLKSNINQSIKYTVDYSFQPEKFAQSQELAEKWRSTHREPGSIEQALLAEKARKDKKLNELKKKFEQDELKECSFKPKTEELPKSYIKSERILDGDTKNAHKGLELYTLASKNKEKKDKMKTSKEIQEEKELEECTFKPNILEKNTAGISGFYSKMQIGADFKGGQVSSPKNIKKIASPKKFSPKVVNSPSNNFYSTENLQTIKETLEDEVSPKLNLNNELETFEKIEEQVLTGAFNEEKVIESVQEDHKDEKNS